MAIALTIAPAPDKEILDLADGVELIGEFEDSGFKEPPLLARRADGQVIQLTQLLYLVAEACDGGRDAAAVAAVASERSGRAVSVENVKFLVEERLRPLGVLALADGTTPELPKRAPLLALRHRRPLVPEHIVNAVARAFAWLHTPLVQVVVVVALLQFDFWLLGVHGIAGGLRSALYDPWLLLGVLGSVVVATAFHEIGHASACRYGGARPGQMGVGVYLVWPAFYCDVTDAYRLDRAGRLRTDLGGVYFNAIFVLLAGGAYFATGQEALLLAAFLQHIIILQQLLPLLRFDGYYVLSDLTGVPDILSRIKPIFRSLVRGRKREPRVNELKPWVRFVVTAYLLLLIPALLFMITWIVLAAPRLLATVYDSLALQLDRLGEADGSELALGAFRFLALAMPVAAMTVSLGRSARMAGTGLVRWSRGSIPRAIVAAGAVAAVAGTAGYTWWPNGDYEPIRPGERGTIGEAVASIPKTPGGRPSFTPEDEAEFGPVPTVRDARAPRPDRNAPAAESVRPGAATPEPDDDAERPADGGAEQPLPDWDEPAPVTEDGAPPATTPATGPTATATPPPTPTPTPTPTPADTPAPTPTATPEPASTPDATSAPAASATPAETSTLTETPTATPTTTP
jgi:putative peptide zinc metalloprotease protein